MNITDLIFVQAKLNPLRPAVAFSGGVATYAMLATAVDSVAEHSRIAGFSRGDLIGIEIRNPLLHLAMVLGLAKRGIASVSLQTTHMIAPSGIKVAAVLMDRYPEQPPPFKVIAVDDGWLVPPQRPMPPEPEAPFSDDVVIVALSSGTTGTPKAVGMTHSMILRRLMRNAVLFGGGRDAARSLSMIGFAAFGGTAIALLTLWRGGLVCFASDPAQVVETVQLFGVTEILASPIQLHAVTEVQRSAGGAMLSSLQTVAVAGSRSMQALISEIRSKLCSNLIITYGSTEAGLSAVAPAARIDGIEGAAGFVMPWSEVQTVDNGGRILALGEEGILRVRSDESVSAYAAPTPRDAEIFRDGWFYPGDIGIVRADGVLIVSGRAAEIINRGGAKVAPEVVEEVLMGRADVAEAAVVGVTNSAGFDEIWAAVIPRPGFEREKVFQHCRERLVDRAPDVLLEVPTIPRNYMGKVDRDRLKTELRHRIELAKAGGSGPPGR